MIPYVDLSAQHRALMPELLAAVQRVLEHGWFILGPEVAELEARLARRAGAPHAIGVNSGTDALVLALQLAGVGPGDEVLTVSHSFVATASAIAIVGATPVFVDVDDATMLMDPDALEAARTPRTRAVLPVHLGGFACDMTRIQGFCETHGLALIEDCAQSLGATHAGRPVGSFGIGAFSLHPLKVLSACGDAGFITVHSEAHDTALRRMRNIGLRDRDHVDMISGNSRLDTLQAALLLVKEPHFDIWVAARQAHAAAYREALGARVRCVPAAEGESAVYSTFVIRHPERDALLAGIRTRGVDAKVHYPIPIHRQPAFSGAYDLQTTDCVVSEIISLPVTPELTASQRERVIDAVLDALDEVEG